MWIQIGAYKLICSTHTIINDREWACSVALQFHFVGWWNLISLLIIMDLIIKRLMNDLKHVLIRVWSEIPSNTLYLMAMITVQ